ncbi:trithorax group protein osa [Aplysia californica]|uniref:Trithorax group protein osa n=1 Tax=Aplysia californica TaxID=6500 RepID=A0ABM1AC33_APLCA|nr:trithorax group protein osa [Aplysia californica]
MVSPGSDSGSLTTDESGLPVKRNKYAKISIGTCSNCGQGKQPMVNWAELLPPPPEHPPPSEMGDSGDSMHRHNNSNNMAETRFINNRSPISPVSKISACSCPIPHDRMVPNLRANIPYSDIEYPTHPGPAHSRYHGDTYQDGSGGSCAGGSGSGGGGGGGGSGSSNYNSDARSYSPKPVGSVRSQQTTTDALLHRCQSPLSCHNCGSSIHQHQQQQQQQQQQSATASAMSTSSSAPPPPPPLSSSSSYNPHLHHHPAAHPENFVTLAGAGGQRVCLPDINDQRAAGGGLYSPIAGVGGAYPPQASMAGSFSQQQGGGACPYSPPPPYPYPNPPPALHGYRIPPLESSDQRNSSDLEQVAQGRGYPSGGGAMQDGGPHMDRACQSSLPSLANECMQPGYGRR